jgi:hypothetical protein
MFDYRIKIEESKTFVKEMTCFIFKKIILKLFHRNIYYYVFILVPLILVV